MSSVLCTQCYQYLWIVHSWFPLRFSLMFICIYIKYPVIILVRMQIYEEQFSGHTVATWFVYSECSLFLCVDYLLSSCCVCAQHCLCLRRIHSWWERRVDDCIVESGIKHHNLIHSWLSLRYLLRSIYM